MLIRRGDYNNIYRFIVRFPLELDFLVITFCPHFSCHGCVLFRSLVLAYLLPHPLIISLSFPTDLLPSTLISMHFFTQSSLFFLITCPYYLGIPLLVIGSSPTNFIYSSLVLLSFMETTHSHLIIFISAPSNFNQTLASKDLCSLP